MNRCRHGVCRDGAPSSPIADGQGVRAGKTQKSSDAAKTATSTAVMQAVTLGTPVDRRSAGTSTARAGPVACLRPAGRACACRRTSDVFPGRHPILPIALAMLALFVDEWDRAS